MAIPINASSGVGVIIDYYTQNVSGDFFITLLFITISFILLALLFTIPLEFTALLIYPFLIVTTAFYGHFFSVLSVFLIYTSLLLAKNYVFK